MIMEELAIYDAKKKSMQVEQEQAKVSEEPQLFTRIHGTAKSGKLSKYYAALGDGGVETQPEETIYEKNKRAIKNATERAVSFMNPPPTPEEMNAKVPGRTPSELAEAASSAVGKAASYMGSAAESFGEGLSRGAETIRGSQQRFGEMSAEAIDSLYSRMKDGSITDDTIEAARSIKQSLETIVDEGAAYFDESRDRRVAKAKYILSELKRREMKLAEEKAKKLASRK
jgi:hypothetical protein